MRDDPTPKALELGLYAQDVGAPRITWIEILAAVLTVVWIAVVALVNLGGAEDSGGIAFGLMGVLGIIMPIALIWVAASAARTARALRAEAARLQASIDAMRAAYVDQQQRPALDLKPALAEKLEELIQAQGAAALGAPAVFSSQRPMPPGAERPAVTLAPPDMPQPTLALATPVERSAISVADFIKALNFPENEHDKEGFRTLRRALEDRTTERLVRASQDVLTLLSQDGIYMDDLRPDRARPEIWRRFAQGERGRSVAGLGGIRDRSSLVLAAGRMKKDPVFRDAAHHFLRHFDRTFMEFEKNADDAEIADLADTRTARAFMLLGRVAGTFD
jgi:hypothetical protein